MRTSPRLAPLTKLSLLGLALLAGCSNALSNQTASVVSSSSVWLRNTYDTDPSIYVGRFVPAGVTELDESNTMVLACSKYITTRFIEGGNVQYTEDLHVSNQVALKIGMPVVASGSAGYQHQRTAQVRYTLTGKLVAEISDPDGFAACCKEQPDQCTDRFVGEFIQGTGSVYHNAARDMNIEGQGTNPANGLAGEGGASRSVEWQRAAEFPEPVYFAFKINPTPYSQGIVNTCPDWVDSPPKSDTGVYVVGSSDNNRNEEAARNAALRSAGNMAARSTGLFVPVQAEEWCVSTSTKGKKTRYSARVLGYVSNDAVALAREQARLEAEREAAELAAAREAAERDAANPPQDQPGDDGFGSDSGGTGSGGTGSAELTGILAAVQAEVSSADKLSALDLAVQGKRLTAAEAVKVLDEFAMGSDKLAALELMRDQISDPGNWQVLVDAFTFSGDREAARALAPGQ